MLDKPSCLLVITILCFINSAKAGTSISNSTTSHIWANSSSTVSSRTSQSSNSGTIRLSSSSFGSSSVVLGTGISSSSIPASVPISSSPISSSSNPASIPISSSPISSSSNPASFPISSSPISSITVQSQSSLPASVIPIITTITKSGTTEVTTIPGSSISALPIITIDWNTVTPVTTSGVSTATHDSHGFPIIPVLGCWFCPPSGGGGAGIVIPGIVGPGILPPPPAAIEISLGFSANMPSITLDPQGNPSYPTEPTNKPTNGPTTSPSPTNSQSCTASSTVTDCTIETIFSTLVFASGSISESAFSTTVSTITTSTCSTVTGCDVTGTTVTTTSAEASTTVDSCPISAAASISSLYASQIAAAVTVVSGTTTPFAFYAPDTPDGLTIASFGFAANSSSVPVTSSPIPVSTSVPIVSSSPIPVSTSIPIISSSSAPLTLSSSFSTVPISTPVTSSPAPVSTSTPSSSPTPTGFHLVALSCSGSDCQDALEIVPSAQDSCGTIAQNQESWWGAAFPDPAETKTESNADEIPPFSVLSDSSNFDVLYVFGDNFSATLCGLPLLNFTFTLTSGSQWTWLDTDNNAGTCFDNSGASSTSCDYNGLTYTAQELLVCVQPENPSYCASVSV